MKITYTDIKDLIIIEPNVFNDERGYFFESYNASKISELKQISWVQDNESKSTLGVLRGLHYQCGGASQAKLVRAVTGKIFDVAVDIRRNSTTYGQWFGVILSEENKKQLYIPRGFAHGFVVLSDIAIFSYKCDNYYNKESEGGIIYNDAKLNIQWPIDQKEIVLSDKDALLPDFGKHLSA